MRCRRRERSRSHVPPRWASRLPLGKKSFLAPAARKGRLPSPGTEREPRARSSSPLAFTASPVKPSFSAETRAPENGPAAGERLAGAVERSLFLSPRRTERRLGTCPRRRRRVGASTLWSATTSARPAATGAANPRRQGRKRRNPRGFLLEGFCETIPSEFLRREILAQTLTALAVWVDPFKLLKSRGALLLNAGSLVRARRPEPFFSRREPSARVGKQKPPRSDPRGLRRFSPELRAFRALPVLQRRSRACSQRAPSALDERCVGQLSRSLSCPVGREKPRGV